MKYKILLLIAILFLVPKVYALEYNVTNSITSPVAPSGNGTYTGEEQNGATSSWKVNTRYQGTLQRIRYNIPVPDAVGECYWTNMSYKITMYMATEDWRNRFGTVKVVPYSSYSGNWSNGKVTFVSMKKIYFSFKIPASDTTCHDFVYVDLPSNQTFNPFTGVSNWNLSKITLTDSISSGGSSGGGGTATPTPTPGASNQDIINNANQNTHDIINNQNDNVQDIIENNNQNTEDIINNINKDCPVELALTNINLYFNETGYLDSNGSIANGAYRVSKYLEIKPNQNYNIDFNFSSLDPIYTCLYNGRKQVTRCLPSNNKTLSLTSTSNELYMRLTGTYRTGQLFPTYIEGPICNNWELETQNDIKNTIKDDNIDNGLGSGFFDNFDDNNHGLTSIITAPLTAIERITSSTCQPLVLPIPFTNSSVSLPCMTEVYNNWIPTIYNIWKVVSFGIIAYFICIDIFHIVKGFKDPESDKVEVLDL